MTRKILSLTSVAIIITLSLQQLVWAWPADDLRHPFVNTKRGALRPLSRQERGGAAGERENKASQIGPRDDTIERLAIPGIRFTNVRPDPRDTQATARKAGARAFHYDSAALAGGVKPNEASPLDEEARPQQSGQGAQKHGLVNVDWHQERVLEEQRKFYANTEKITAVLKEKLAAVKEEPTRIVFPAGDWDVDTLIGLLMIFPSIEEVFLVSLFDNANDALRKQEITKKWMEHFKRRVDEHQLNKNISVHLLIQDYYTTKEICGKKPTGRTVLVDKYPGHQSSMRNDPRYRNSILRDTQPHDLIVSVRDDSTQQIRWHNQEFLKDLTFPFHFEQQGRWSVCILAPEDFEQASSNDSEGAHRALHSSILRPRPYEESRRGRPVAVGERSRRNVGSQLHTSRSGPRHPYTRPDGLSSNGGEFLFNPLKLHPGSQCLKNYIDRSADTLDTGSSVLHVLINRNILFNQVFINHSFCLPAVVYHIFQPASSFFKIQIQIAIGTVPQVAISQGAASIAFHSSILRPLAAGEGESRDAVEVRIGSRVRIGSVFQGAISEIEGSI